MSEQAQKGRRNRRARFWLAKRIYRFNPKTRNGPRARIRALLIEHHPWWDWGHRLMILVGTDDGNWSEPEPETWWYRSNGSRLMWRTGYPRRTFQIVKDYKEFRDLTDGSNEDEMYAWSAFAFDQDGQLILGHRWWGKDFYGLPRDELKLLNRYLRMARRHDWFGLRSWLYTLGLHAAVNAKKPWTCQAVPPKGQGGYQHWFCQLPRRHEGMHRFRNYVFGDIEGEPIGAHFMPEETKR